MGTGIINALKTSLDNVIATDKEADSKAYEINYSILNNLDKRLQKRFLFPSERKQIIDAIVGDVAGLVVTTVGALFGVKFLKKD